MTERFKALAQIARGERDAVDRFGDYVIAWHTVEQLTDCLFDVLKVLDSFEGANDVSVRRLLNAAYAAAAGGLIDEGVFDDDPEGGA